MKGLLILIITIFFVSYSYSQKKEIPAELLNRTWSKTTSTPPVTYTLVFKSDSTFIFTSPAHDIPPTINYTANDSMLTFPAAGCPGEGKYNYVIKGNELIFHVNDDSCTGRVDVVEGIWTDLKTKTD